ncbi:MAG: choice-of-anchor D domain-containing protein [Gammaproteobacteria bacterium]
MLGAVQADEGCYVESWQWGAGCKNICSDFSSDKNCYDGCDSQTANFYLQCPGNTPVDLPPLPPHEQCFETCAPSYKACLLNCGDQLCEFYCDSIYVSCASKCYKESGSDIELFGNVDYGGVWLSSSGLVHTFRIENQGGGALHLMGTPRVTTIGPHAGDFTVTAQPNSTVEPGESTTFAISFAPVGEGLRETIVSIANDDHDEYALEFAIRGRGNANPRLPTWRPDSADHDNDMDLKYIWLHTLEGQ